MMYKWLIGLVLLVSTATAQAAVNVVATTPAMGMLAETVGGDAVSVRVLAPADRDAHYLQARPSMMAALRGADLVVSVGAELEVGWLPAAIRGANNPGVFPGRTGYFEAAAQVDLIGVGGPADRALGDVHPAGNPHVNMDPVRMAQVAHALADRLIRFDSANAEQFRANAEAFERKVEEHLPVWRERVADAPGVVFFHEDADYLAKRLDVPVLGYVEPLPGIPPTARHLRDLVRDLEGRDGVVIRATFHQERGPRFVGEQLDWPVYALPLDPEVGATADDYFDLIGQWVDAMAGKL
ncbi:metal ABC transporter substrate-binding protein [Ectothiorhodospira variabilis]|uniref:metal ABC transporter substrate-binding protein n=2 Tax=Ectothiorhodospira variabilis TaxID=505694 RepID=UPI0030843CD2